MKCCRNVEAGVFNEHCSFILEMMLQGGHWVAIIGYCSIILNIIGSCTILTGMNIRALVHNTYCKFCPICLASFQQFLLILPPFHPFKWTKRLKVWKSSKSGPEKIQI